MKKIYLVLVGIFLLGFLLRFYRLGEIPIGFHRDEAYLGYNAYSILNTGREMSGDFLPIHLKSFLFSPALYSYFSIPFVFIFGLSEFSVRFASALFGSLTVLVTFFFVKIIFKDKEIHNTKYKILDTNILALLSSLFFAISPWSINLSRVATDNVIVVFLITSGVYFYIKWIDRSKIKFLIISAILFVISLYTYQAPRAFLPPFLPLMYLIFAYKQKKKLVISFVIYLIFIILPIVSILLTHDLSLRFRMLSIFNAPGTQLILDEKIREDGIMNITPMIARVFDNKIISYTQTFILNYSDHFSFRFLFT
nr:glycosyltransferase family 39 protein [Candidatus Levybacteria bacterium]